jgi:hypothetical protein
MKPVPLMTAALLSLALATAFAGEREMICLDLQSQCNQKLKEILHNGGPGNDLADLPTGKQKLDGVTFEIGAGMIQLGSTEVKNKPDRVEGIPVNQTFERLHLLHAAAFSMEDNVVVGLYVVHYDDNSSEKFEMVFGQDLGDWWFGPEDREPARCKVAWVGNNEPAKSTNRKVRLYHMTWKNPKPDRKVVSMDMLVADGSVCAPFCVAMTVE